MEMGAKFPEWFISKVRTSSAELPLKEKSPVMASCRKGLKFDAAAVNAGRLFGSRGSGGRQDVLITEEAIEPLASDGGQDARAAYKKAQKKGVGKKKKDGVPRRGRGNVIGAGQTLHGPSRRMGQRERRNRRDIEYHLAPKRPWRDTARGDRGPAPQERDEARRPSYSSISTDTPVSAQTRSDCEQAFSAALDMVGLIMVSKGDSVVVSDARATPNMACFRWLEHHHRLLERSGPQKASTNRSDARSRFGDGLPGEVRHAACIPAGVAGSKGMFIAFVLDADIPALLRKDAVEALGGQLDFSRDSSVLLKEGVASPLRANMLGDYNLCVVDFGAGASRKVRRPVVSASYFE